MKLGRFLQLSMNGNVSEAMLDKDAMVTIYLVIGGVPV